MKKYNSIDYSNAYNLINDYKNILNNDNPGIEDIMLHHIKGGLE